MAWHGVDDPRWDAEAQARAGTHAFVDFPVTAFGGGEDDPWLAADA
jgi:hypothetical protein